MILEGSTSVDEAAITGESIPVFKAAGDRVIAATMNKTGFFKMKADKTGDDTVFSRIIRLVEEASASKAPIARMADKIAGIFVPVVMGIALVTVAVWLLLGAGFEFALSCGIAVLVISCPCALGLATPVAIMVGTGKGAENGILIKSGEALEVAHNIQSVVLDKTGTITQGKPVVTDIYPVHTSPQKLLEIAGALEMKSEHPLAEAILAKVKEENTALPETENFLAVTGKGVQAVIEGQTYYAGNSKLMEEHHIDCREIQPLMEKLAEDGKTPLIFADEKQVLGIIGATDVVKPTSAQAVKELKKLGIRVIMLTGDNARTAKAIQKQLEIDTVIAEVLPQDKEREVANIQKSGQVVAMVGDGINDAPALARADVGIAIGAGTDVAIESADIVLIKSSLMDAVAAVELSKATIKNIKENLFWAFFYNCIGIPIAAGLLWVPFGIKLSPMIGAAAMSLSSVCVVSNALRLRFFSATPRKTAGTPAVLPVSGEKPLTAHKKEENVMEKTIKVEGMMCQHCVAHVKKALEGAAAGCNVAVDLDAGKAVVSGKTLPEDAVLTAAVTEAGYKVVDIK